MLTGSVPDGRQPVPGRKSATPRPWAFAVFLVACVAFLAARAPAQAKTFRFDIPAAPLDQALTAFSQISDAQIIFSQALIDGRRGSAVHGQYSPMQALDALLRETGLAAQVNAGGVLMILPAPRPSSPPPVQPPRQAVAEPVYTETAVVTGSRLSSEYNASSPVTRILPEQAANSGLFDTQAMIARIPAASGTQQVNNMLSATNAGGNVPIGGTNVNTIALRNLGASRTLTLVDGHRLAPAGVGSMVGPVDLNVIPASIIDHVDVLTDGASSIYGSDAIAGVINIVTRQAADGITANLSSNMTQHGGANAYQGSIAWARTFGQGHVAVSAQYDQQNPLLTRQRPQTACARGYVRDAGGQIVDPADTNGTFKCRNLNPTGVFFAQNGYDGWFQYAPSAAGYPAAALNVRNALPDWVQTGRPGFPDTFQYAISDSPAFQNANVIAPFKRASIYTEGTYSIGSAEVYGSLLLNQRDSSSESWMFLYPILDVSNPSNTVGSALAAASGGLSNGNVQPQVNVPFRSTQHILYGQGLIGLRGRFDGAGLLQDWSWDISAQEGRSVGTYAQTFFYQDRVAAATGPGMACNPALITVSGPTPCISIPWLSPAFLVDQAWTPAQRSFLEGDETGQTTNNLFSLDGQLTGPVFALPAGPVSAALGYSLRLEYLDDEPGPNAQAHNYFAFSTAGVTKGSDVIKEVFGEVGIPLLAGAPFADRLDITASGRFTDYSSYGSGLTYKVGANWRIVPGLALHANYGTSFRAPSLYELFLANRSSFFPYFDPCAHWGQSGDQIVRQNCAAAGLASTFTPLSSDIVAIQGGGAGHLKAETSTNVTAGAVIRPAFTDMKIGVDYYDISLRNEVAAYGVNNIITQCYGLAQGNQSFCAKITRNPATGEIASVDNSLVNIAEERRRGVDVNGQYGFGLADMHVDLQTQWTWTLQNSTWRDPSMAPQDSNGLSGDPQSTGWAEAAATRGEWTLAYGMNYIGPTNDAKFYATGNSFAYFGAYAGLSDYGNPNAALNGTELLKVPAYVTQYASIRWQADGIRLQAGIKNLFDIPPPVQGQHSVALRIGSVPSNLYDFDGRAFFMSLTRTF